MALKRSDSRREAALASRRARRPELTVQQLRREQLRLLYGFGVCAQ